MARTALLFTIDSAGNRKVADGSDVAELTKQFRALRENPPAGISGAELWTSSGGKVKEFKVKPERRSPKTTEPVTGSAEVQPESQPLTRKTKR